MLIYFRCTQFGVAFTGAFELSLISAHNARSDGLAVFVFWAVLIQCADFQLRHFYMNIDAIEQGSGYAIAMASLLFEAALAQVFAVTAVTLWTRIHRAYQLKVCREFRLACSARDGDAACFHGFAKNIEYVTIELCEFIKKEHAMMRQ